MAGADDLTPRGEEVLEELAAYAHEAWSGWMKYMFGKSIKYPDGNILIPASLVKRWTMQMSTKYEDLPEEMKPSDRDEARKMLDIMGDCDGL